MNDLCPSCSEVLVDGLCLACDVAETLEDAEVVSVDAPEPPPEPEDPLIGRVFADRYEIRKLHGTGGMARVYRAVQRSLEREVVVKVISPELLAQGELTAEEAAARFFIEAQAASKLNHPNVVSVFDFGRTAPADGGLLFLVMEYLTGPDLWTVQQQEPVMPLARIASILQQVLAALAEAHYLGIAHRDIKPENILLEPTRGGRDLVKVIDFGTAKLGGLQSVTRAGQTVGTPHYMAPEQIEGSAVGSADLYAVGIILFELLTGQLPFDGAHPLEILRKHLSAPRPDPREVAPDRDIPAALAAVCMRAMHVDPAQRLPDADSLSAAIVRATGSTEWASRATIPRFSLLPPPRTPSVPPPARARVSPGAEAAAEPAPKPSPPAMPASRSPPSAADRDGGRPPPPPASGDRAAPAGAPAGRIAGDAPGAGAAAGGLLGREAELAWASKALASPVQGVCLALHGEPGVGRTRLATDIADAAEKRGLRVVRVRGPGSPRRELTYAGIRRIIAALTGLDPELASAEAGLAAARDTAAAAGLRAIFSLGGSTEATEPEQARANAAAAFAWAARRAVERAAGARVLLAVDDADRLDNASRLAFSEGLGRLSTPSFFALTTSEAPLPLPEDRSAQRALSGLPPADAARLLSQLGGPRDGLGTADREVEPLYVEILRRWKLDESGSRAPTRLLDLVASGLRALSAPQRRLLLVVAVTGGGPRAELSTIARREDVDRAIDPLIGSGILEDDPEEGIRVSHEVFARVAIATAPGEAVAELHAAAAEALAEKPEHGELRAYHAVRGRPDFETFLLVEQCAALRARSGDDEGAADVLWAAMRAGRTMLRHGDLEAGGSACVVFGQKLGAALRAIGRYEEALAVLRESLDLTGAEDAARARVLEELSRSAGSLGMRPDAERWRREALAIARRRDDRPLVQRLVALARE